MNEQTLSNRLAKVAEYVRKNDRLADIGSDHAYLPAWLILNDRINFAVAGEVVEGPYQSAKKLVTSLALTERITVRLADGLGAVEPSDKISAITIAGMGGRLISEILDRGFQEKQLTGSERLILQPNVGEKVLRQWLLSHQYQIIAEAILEEDRKFYEVIVAEKSPDPVTYTEQELAFGPFLSAEQSPVFKAKWQSEVGHHQGVLKRLKLAKQEPSARMVELSKKIAEIEEILK